MRRSYDVLADLLEYPDAGAALESAECGGLLKSECAAFVGDFALFIHQSDALSPSERQELYTRTFDLNPACALEIGYHLFGENYKRGAFLANLRETEAPFDLGQEYQLPDYLPVLLRLLSRLDDEDLRSSLIADCIIPALEKMLQKLSETENPYRRLLAAIKTLLKLETGSSSTSNHRAQLPVLEAGAAVGAAHNRDLF